MERTPAIYILASQKRGTLYIGVTSDPIGRWWRHREGVLDGFSERHGVKRLVHVEFFGDMEHAIVREKHLKNWRREWKVNLIKAGNPGWRDLALDYGLEPLTNHQPRARDEGPRMDAETSSA